MSYYKGIRIAVLCGATVLTSGVVFGQTCKSGCAMQGGSSSYSAHDKMFLKKSAEGNMAEIKTAQIALQNASSQDVKDFAQKMIDDHTKLAENMKPFMEKANVPEPTELDPKDEAMDKKLSAMKGTDFDNSYIKSMVKDHQTDLKAFKMEVSMTKNPDLKSAVGEGEQVIQGHVNIIDGIAAKHGISAPHAAAM